MRRHVFGALAMATVGVLALSACGSSDDSSSGSGGSSGDTAKGSVGVILPDTASSARYETADRPLLQKAFDAAGIKVDIQNAQGDTARFQSIGEGMLNAGVKVLIIDSIDETAGQLIAKATQVGVPVIDYDRLTAGGGASYYVSFDNVKVGEAMGTALVDCMKDAGTTSGGVVELNGAPTDNNATLFKQGYDKVIKAAGYTVAADQAVKDWSNDQAKTDFEQIYTKTGGKFVGVAAANDGLAGSVDTVLKQNNLSGKVPVTGQDATDEGLQRVLLGTQCVTVYKAVSKEATAASDLAIKLLKGDKAGADAAATGTTKDPKTSKDVPSVLLEPQAITKDNVKAVIDDGFTTADKVCTTADLKKACTEAGIS